MSHCATYEWIAPLNILHHTHTLFSKMALHVNEWMNKRVTYVTPCYMWMNYTTVWITPHTYTSLKMALHVNEWMNHVTPCYVWMNYTIHIHFFENRVATKYYVFHWGRVLCTKRLNLVDINLCVDVIFLHLQWVQRILHTSALRSWASAFPVSLLHVSWVRDVGHDSWHAIYFFGYMSGSRCAHGPRLVDVCYKWDQFDFFSPWCVCVCVCVYVCAYRVILRRVLRSKGEYNSHTHSLSDTSTTHTPPTTHDA